MQPTYLPWLGYLDMIDRVDEFVVLDTVQFERHSWQHRNRIKTAQGEHMLTVPVERTGLDTVLLDARIADEKAVTKHLRTIEQSYARAQHFAPARADLASFLSSPGRSLADFLVRVIDWLRDRLGITTPMVRASTLEASGRRDELVRSICDAMGATHYLAAPGSRDYMEAGTAFVDGNIEVEYHHFDCRPYPQQHGAFMPYLSSLDAILNLGPGAREVMLAGRRNPT